jgi:hypothetical protein
MRILTFDLASYDFPAEIRTLLGVRDLSALRAGGSFDPEAALYRNMQEAEPYRRLMQALSDRERAARLADLYRRFVAERIAPEHEGPLLYQARPTFRMLFPEMSGESRFHRDRDYGHQAAEINYSVALTPCFGTNAIWIESREGLEDYQPIELEPGEMVEFDGATLKHGALRNATEVCRVSFDFRVLPVARANGRIESEPSWTAEPDPHRFARCPVIVSRLAEAP